MVLDTIEMAIIVFVIKPLTRNLFKCAHRKQIQTSQNSSNYRGFCGSSRCSSKEIDYIRFKLLAYKYSGRMWKGLQNFQDLCNNMKCSLINLCLKLDFSDKQLDELLGEKGNAFKGEGKQVHLRNCYICLTSIHQYLQTLPLGSLWTLLRTRMLILIMMQRHERKGNKLNLCFSINVKTQIERNCFLF